MTSALGPSLGRIAAPPSGGRWDAIRLDLLDTLVRGTTAGPRSSETWLGAWHAAVEALRDDLLAESRAMITAAGRRARYPTTRQDRLLPDPEQADILLQRLLAEGMPLERLAGAGSTAEVTRARAAALETAWDGAVAVARGERQRWTAEAARVAAWRRPWWPVFVAGAVLVVAAGVAAAWLGGQLPAPGWFTPVAQWFWDFPWP